MPPAPPAPAPPPRPPAPPPPPGPPGGTPRPPRPGPRRPGPIAPPLAPGEDPFRTQFSRPARDNPRELAPLSREDSDVRGEPRAPDADPEGPRRRRRGAGRVA